MSSKFYKKRARTDSARADFVMNKMKEFVLPT